MPLRPRIIGFSDRYCYWTGYSDLQRFAAPLYLRLAPIDLQFFQVALRVPQPTHGVAPLMLQKAFRYSIVCGWSEKFKFIPTSAESTYSWRNTIQCIEAEVLRVRPHP